MSESNPDLVPFEAQDARAIIQAMCVPDDLVHCINLMGALNTVLGGKPRPPRTHAVTVEELVSIYHSSRSAVEEFSSLQNILQRTLSVDDYDAIWNGNPIADVAKINERFGLTPAPETEDEKWARIRREGLNKDEAAKMNQWVADNCPADSDDVDVILVAFRKVLGIGEVGVRPSTPKGSIL